jgi:hypothetical protein
VAAVATAALAACGNAASDSTAEPTSHTNASGVADHPIPNATYADAASLRDAAVAAGYRCGQWKVRMNTMAASAGECSPASFATFQSHADVVSALHLVLGSDGDLGHGVVTQSYLVGPNWIIASLDRGQLKMVSRDLGGDIHHA